MTRLRPAQIGAACLIGLAALPLWTPLGRMLTADHPDRLATVLTGLQFFRLMLLVHAALLLLPRPGQAAQQPEGDQGGTVSSALPWVVGLLLVLGLVVRLVGLSEGLWYDEMQTLVEYVRLPLARIVSSYDNTNQHLFYSILARISVDLLGESPAALRLPAALLGVASLGAVFWFGRMVAHTREALLATAALAVSYHHIWFSQNARGYTGLMAFTLVASGFFLRLMAGEGRPGWMALGYAAATALAAYTHVTAIFVSVAHFMVWLAAWVRATPARRRELAGWPLLAFVLAASFTLQLYAIVLPQVVAAFTTPSTEPVTGAWKSPGWFALEALRGLARGVPGGLLSVGVAGLIGALGLVSHGRRSGRALAVMLLPFGTTALTLLALHHNLWPRFFFFGAGFAVLILLRGWFTAAERLPVPGASRMAAALTLLGIAGLAFLMPRAWRPKQDFGGALRFIEQAAAPGDAILTVDLTEMPYQRYYGRDWPGISSVDELEGIEKRHPRTWVVTTFPLRLAAVQPDVYRRLTSAYDSAAAFPGTLGGGTVTVYTSRSGNGGAP